MNKAQERIMLMLDEIILLNAEVRELIIKIESEVISDED